MAANEPGDIVVRMRDVLVTPGSCNLVPRASVTLVQRNGRGKLRNNPKPEPEKSSSG